MMTDETCAAEALAGLIDGAVEPLADLLAAARKCSEPICDQCGQEMKVIYGGGDFDIFCRTCDEVTGEERDTFVTDFWDRCKLAMNPTGEE
jgi:hypothetical protein